MKNIVEETIGYLILINPNLYKNMNKKELYVTLTTFFTKIFGKLNFKEDELYFVPEDHAIGIITPKKDILYYSTLDNNIVFEDIENNRLITISSFINEDLVTILDANNNTNTIKNYYINFDEKDNPRVIISSNEIEMTEQRADDYFEIELCENKKFYYDIKITKYFSTGKIDYIKRFEVRKKDESLANLYDSLINDAEHVFGEIESKRVRTRF